MPVAIIGKYSSLRPQSVWTIEDPDLPGGKVSGEMRHCVHCQGAWVHNPQSHSGRIRGWCDHCKGYLCGPQCAECLGPAMKRIELIEAGKLFSMYGGFLR